MFKCLGFINHSILELFLECLDLDSRILFGLELGWICEWDLFKYLN